jgi:hypothetical protein
MALRCSHHDKKKGCFVRMVAIHGAGMSVTLHVHPHVLPAQHVLGQKLELLSCMVVDEKPLQKWDGKLLVWSRYCGMQDASTGFRSRIIRLRTHL